MNFPMITYIMSKIMGVGALLVMIPAFVALYFKEECAGSFLITAVLMAAMYLLLGRKRPENKTIYNKDGFIVVALVWVFYSLFGCLPFILSGAIPSFEDALFETISGFTTTGATILTEIESLPRGILFWRNFTHWIGGMGVLVFVLAFIPLVDKRSIYLLRAEMPGPTLDKLVPKVKDTAKILYGMYFLLSFAELIFLLFGGMSLYDSILHVFSTAGTGGFSPKNNSISYYNSAYIEWVITIFMTLFGINFNLYYMLFLKRWKTVLKSEELRAYIAILLISSLAIGLNIMNQYKFIGKAFRDAFFQVTSIMSTTGFMSADYDLWPTFSKVILLGVMSIGACAGSTGGGIKVSRILILFKTVVRGVKQLIHPHTVQTIKMDGKRIDKEVLDGTYVFIIAHVLIVCISVLLLSLNNFDFQTTFTAVITTINNTGPGIGDVGPTLNFSPFSIFSKLVLCANMLIGRLEIFPFLVLISPFWWRKKI